MLLWGHRQPSIRPLLLLRAWFVVIPCTKWTLVVTAPCKFNLCLKRPSYYCLIHFYKRCVSGLPSTWSLTFEFSQVECLSLSVTNHVYAGLKKAHSNLYINLFKCTEVIECRTQLVEGWQPVIKKKKKKNLARESLSIFHKFVTQNYGITPYRDKHFQTGQSSFQEHTKLSLSVVQHSPDLFMYSYLSSFASSNFVKPSALPPGKEEQK